MARKATSVAGHFGGDVKVVYNQNDISKVISDMERYTKNTRKSVRRAVSAGGKELKSGIKEAAPVETGFLKRKVATRARTYKRGTLFYSIVGAKWIEGPKNPAVYIHVLEDGGQKRSKGTRPFARSAFDDRAPRARAEVLAVLRRELKTIRGF